MRVFVLVSPPADGVHQVEVRLGEKDGELLGDRRMETLSPPDGNLEERGRYLFDRLLGEELWQAILTRARGLPATTVELALSWDAAQSDLQVPSWEAMHDGEDFLGAHSEISVAVTRIVADAPEEPEPTPAPAPARVLFVIGADLNDPDIRPGAEVIGLLRDAERGDGAINARILNEATLAALADECRRFQPHIVHFVSHGSLVEGKGEIELQAGEGDESGWVDGAKLLRAMNTGPEPGPGLPSLVVLTGCETAAAGEHMDSLAAELVKGGIPSVIGMAGRISDTVCRLFSRKFSVALNEGVPLVEAMTHGRRAGLQRQEEPAAEDDAWALPSIYLAPSVPADHAPVDVERFAAIFARQRNYGLLEDPVFCGRAALIGQFDRLLDAGDPLEVLVAYAEGSEPLGKTRLLHEFAGRALRGGHVVVMIDDRGRDMTKLPRSPIELATKLTREIVATRARFELDFPRNSRLLRLLANIAGEELDFDSEPESEWPLLVQEFLGRCSGELDGDALRAALAGDLRQLIEDARASADLSVGSHSRAVVVLGGLGCWDTATEMLWNDLLRPQGLGEDGEHVPVLATCSFTDPAEEFMRQMRQATNGLRWVRHEKLEPFCEGEDTLASQWVLLHPRTIHEHSNRVYAPNAAKEPVWEGIYRETFRGLPGMFEDDRFYLLAHALEQTKDFIGADDDRVLKEYAKRL